MITKKLFKLALSALLAAYPLKVIRGQNLTPRAYVITPVHSNAVILTYSFNDGGILLNNVLPVTNGTAAIHISVFSYYHSLSFFGRSANITASLPYSIGNFQGKFMDSETKLYRSGLVDSSFRFSVNLKGGPAMSWKEMQSWQQKTIVGVSLSVFAPTGQYDGARLINNGTNRWAFRPVLGYSRRKGHLVLDAYAAIWFFRTNPEYWSHNEFYAGTRSQSQYPMGAFESHLSYDVKPRLWLSFDVNTWFGGQTSLNGTPTPNTFQASSLVGATASIPLGKHQSLKVGYNASDYVQFGRNFRNISVAWQYSWIGRPE